MYIPNWAKAFMEIRYPKDPSKFPLEGIKRIDVISTDKVGGDRAMYLRGSRTSSPPPSPYFLPVLANNEPEALTKLETNLQSISSHWQDMIENFLYADEIPIAQGEKVCHEFLDKIHDRLSLADKTFLNYFTSSKFEDLDLGQKNTFIKTLAGNIAKDREIYCLSKKVFNEDFNEEQRHDLINYGRNLYGSQEFYENIPLAVNQAIQRDAKKQFEKFAEGFDELQMRFLDSGAVGVAFQVNIDGHKFVVKMPAAGMMSDSHSAFCAEEKQWDEYEKSIHELIVDKEFDHEWQRFLPSRLRNSDGVPIAIPGEIQALKFLEGENLISVKGREWEVSQSFLNNGVSDEFMLKVMKCLLTFARKQMSLNDIAPHNLLHNKEGFKILELASPNTHRGSSIDNERRDKVFKDNPELATLFIMMESFLIFAAKKRSSGIASAMYAEAHDPIKQGVLQMQRILKLAVKKGIMNKQEIQKAFKDIDILTKKDADIEGAFTLNDHGALALKQLIAYSNKL